MSEAIIVRGGKAIDQSAALSSINNNINNLWDAINDINSKPSIPIYPDRCSILVTVLDSAGTVMENAAVHCLDGTSWYNYTTNSSGQVLFTTNSVSANIKAYGINSAGNYRWIDQVSVYSNVDAPSGTSKEVNMRLTLGTNISFQSISSNIYADDSMFYGNCRIRVANRCNVFIGGAGGGADGDTIATNGGTPYGGEGGGQHEDGGRGSNRGGGGGAGAGGGTWGQEGGNGGPGKLTFYFS